MTLAPIYTGLESYFAVQGQYPSLDQLNDEQWRTANLASVDPAIVHDPRQRPKRNFWQSTRTIQL